MAFDGTVVELYGVGDVRSSDGRVGDGRAGDGRVGDGRVGAPVKLAAVRNAVTGESGTAGPVLGLWRGESVFMALGKVVAVAVEVGVGSSVRS